jgi:hypothetical protein
MMRSFLGTVLLCVLALGSLAGCTGDQHQEAADRAKAAQVFLDEAKKVMGSEVAKGIADAVGKIPTPATQLVPVAREKVEWGLGILSGLVGIFAAWQARKAAEERSKKKVYKANSTKAELDAANKIIYGDKFDEKLSK